MSLCRVALFWTITSLAMAQAFHPVIPRAWDDREVETFEVPLAQPERSPHIFQPTITALELWLSARGGTSEISAVRIPCVSAPREVTVSR